MAETRSEQGSIDEVLQLLTLEASALRERLGEPPYTLHKYQVPVQSATNSLKL